MGFNFSAIVINKNYKDQIDQLQKDLEMNLTFKEEITFEQASANAKPEGLCDIYFAEKATLLFVPFQSDAHYIKDAQVLSFIMVEMVMDMQLKYTENGILKRFISEYNLERRENRGKSLPVETENMETSEIIWKQMDYILGESFNAISLSATCYRYTMA